MNSAEQQDFEHVPPSEDEIAAIVNLIEKKIAEPSTDNKADYQLALSVIKSRDTDYANLPNDFTSDREKAIAVLAVNFLRGESKREALLHYLR